MNKLAFALLALIAVPAFGEKITCAFTEPFITANLDFDAKVVSWRVPEEQNLIWGKILESSTEGRQIRAHLQVRQATHGIVLNQDKTGSDGMSDCIYPIEGVLDGKLFGGCFTQANPAKCPGL